ncbi:hypothetical protein IWQ56_006134, partial [Coemansia nantahalensis]
SSTLYFQSAMHSPIANIASDATKQFARPAFQRYPVLQRYPAARHPYQLPVPMMLRTPQQHGGGHSPAHMGLVFGEMQQQYASAMPVPASPYMYGAAVSCSRSTARVAGRVPSSDSDGMSRGPASLASSFSLESRQPSPYLPSPSSPNDMAPVDLHDCHDSAKLKINHILN